MTAFLLIGTFGLVFAEEEDELELPEAEQIGVLESGIDSLRLAFTFNREAKIERILEMAAKRLAAAEDAAEEDPERIARLQEQYDRLVERANAILEDLESVTEDEDRSIEEIARLARIRNTYERHQEQTDAIYARALNRFEQNNASEEKLARFEGFYERASERNMELASRAVEKQENAIKRHKTIGESTDEEIEEMLEEIEEREGIAEERLERLSRQEDRIDEIFEIRLQNQLRDSNLTEEEQPRIRLRLEYAEGKAEDSVEAKRNRIETRFEYDKRFQEALEDDDDIDEDENESEIDDVEDEDEEDAPGYCTTNYDPVCGENNETYSNSCFAGLANMEIECEGECPCGEESEVNASLVA